MKTVLVFRTSVTSSEKVRTLTPLLDSLMDKYEKWNFDLEDIDNILRVESISVQASEIIRRLQNTGVDCAELED